LLRDLGDGRAALNGASAEICARSVTSATRKSARRTLFLIAHDPITIPRFLASSLHRQFLAADLLQRQQFVPRQAPQHVRRDALILVPQHVANARHLCPRNFRMPGLHLVGQVAAGLRYDFNAAFDQPALLPIGLESIERHSRQHAAYVLNGLDDVGEARKRGTFRH
jgi:hypothetical protein